MIARTTAKRLDLVDPSKGQVVGRSKLTDGVYIWGSDLTYYVREYCLSPGADFVSYCQRKNFEMDELTRDDVAQAVDEMFRRTSPR